MIAELKSQGHNVHIYTTSFRTNRKIRLTLNYYGIKVDRIVNQNKNRRELKNRNINSSKFPPAFGFDIHIDNSNGVGIESERNNFNAIIIEQTDKNWIEKIKTEIKTLHNSVYPQLKRIELCPNPLGIANVCAKPKWTHINP